MDRFINPVSNHSCANSTFFFFFWIIKNLFPKGQNPTKENTRSQKAPRKDEKRTAPPLNQRKRGISPNTKTPDRQKPKAHIRAQPKQTNKQYPTARDKLTKTNKQAHIPGTGKNNQRTAHSPGQGKQGPNSQAHTNSNDHQSQE